MKAPLTSQTFSNDAGFTVLELLIVIAMIAVISGFALIQIVRARQLMIRANAAQELLGYLEKARLDSVRRRPATTAEMAQVQIVNATFYSVTIDADGNGTLDAPRVKSLPSNTDLQFTGSFPRTIYFNWRGRTVNSSNAITTPASITISSATYGSTTINVSDTGQAAIGTITSNPVSNSNPGAPTFRDNTQIP
jgi:prepilin-type N-terminal cleavage/methylation domain-containing protein